MKFHEKSFGHLKYSDMAGMNIYKDKLTDIEIVAHNGVVTENVIQEAIVLCITLKADVKLYSDCGHQTHLIYYNNMMKAVVPKVVFK